MHQTLIRVGLAVCLGLLIGNRVISAEAATLPGALEHWDRRADLKEAQAAAAEYSEVLDQDPANFEAAWRAAQAYHWVGDHSQGRDRLANFEKAKAVAERAVKLNPKAVEGHYWLASSTGSTGQEQGILQSLWMIDPMIQGLETVLSIDPRYAYAQYVLGIVYRKIPGWPISRGDIRKSLEYAQQAVANRPETVLIRIGLAETLLAMGRRDEARQVLLEAMSLSGMPDEAADTMENKLKAAKMLKDLK